MMKIDYQRIKEFLEGKLNEEQSFQVENWLKAPQNEEEARKMLGELWSRSEIKLNGNRPDFDFLLSKVHYRILLKQNNNRRKIQPILKIYRQFSKAAAILIFPLLLLTAYLYFKANENYSVSDTVAIREVHTKPGTRTKIELPDGTFVWLNDGTVLKYPEQFAGKIRQVFLDGEAYFEVKSNKKRPFIVDNPIMKTVVTGTHFNLYAYSVDHYFEASLLEGEIRLEGQAGNMDLLPGQQIQFNDISKKISKNENKAENSAAWVNGKLIIHNERLDIAIKKLSRWYNIDINIADPELNSYELTCTLENEKIEQCMNLISHALPIQYELTNMLNPDYSTYKIELMKK